LVGEILVKKLKQISTLVKALQMYTNLTHFLNMMENDATCQYDGFMFHEGLGYGKMIKTYPFGCESPENESWPLFLRAQPSGRKK